MSIEVRVMTDSCSLLSGLFMMDSVHCCSSTELLQDNTTMEESEPEEAEEEAAEPELTLEGLLEKVGLKDKADVFHQEQIDLESLVGSNLHLAMVKDHPLERLPWF